MDSFLKNTFLTGITSFLLLFFIVKTNASSQESGWENKGEYLEQKLKIGNITFLQYSKDGKHFYTFSSDNIFRKWESESGVLVDTFQIPFEAYSPALSPNQTKFAVSRRTGKFDSTYVFDVISKEQIIIIEPLINLTLKSDEGLISNKNLIIFITDSTLLNIANYNYYFYNGKYNSSRSWSNNWSISKKCFLENIKQLNSVDSMKSFYNEYFFYNFNFRTERYSAGVYEIWEASFLTLLNQKLQKQFNYFFRRNVGAIGGNNKYEYIDRMYNCYITSDLRYFVGLYQDNELYFWNFETIPTLNIEPILHHKVKLGYAYSELYPKDLIFTSDNRYFITTSKVHEKNDMIRVWDLETGILLSSIQNSANLIVLQDSSNKLLTAYGGNIKHLAIPFLNKKLKAVFKPDTNKLLVNQTLTFSEYSYGYPNEYFWNFGDGQVSYEKHPVHKYTKPGKYAVTLSVSDGINHDVYTSNDTISVVEEIVSVSDNNFEALKAKYDCSLKNLSIFPNPNSGTGKIKFTLETPGEVKIKLYSMTGIYLETLFEDILLSGINTIHFDLANYAEGVYFYSVEQNGNFLSFGKITFLK